MRLDYALENCKYVRISNILYFSKHRRKQINVSPSESHDLLFSIFIREKCTENFSFHLSYTQSISGGTLKSIDYQVFKNYSYTF